MFLSKLFTYLTCTYLKNKRCFNVKSLTFYFHMKTKTLADFQICISVPLRIEASCSCAKFYITLLTCDPRHRPLLWKNAASQDSWLLLMMNEEWKLITFWLYYAHFLKKFIIIQSTVEFLFKLYIHLRISLLFLHFLSDAFMCIDIFCLIIFQMPTSSCFVMVQTQFLNHWSVTYDVGLIEMTSKFLKSFDKKLSLAEHQT